MVDARSIDYTANDPDSDEPLSFPWRIDDGRVDVTLEMCNAVRCAAHDGHSYRTIGEMFSFLSGKQNARLHAIGECRHTGGVAPVGPRQPGPGNRVTRLACNRMRRRYRTGEYETTRAAADEEDVSPNAAWRHITGECSHR